VLAKVETMTRIAIDARELMGRPTGVGRLVSEIVREWNRLPAAAHHELVFCSPEPIDLCGVRARTLTAPGRGTRWEQTVLPRLVRAVDADVLFAPAYSGPLLCPVPMVVAIHDVSFAAHPEWFRWLEGLRRRTITRAAARRAARVITISRFSCAEIVTHLGVPDACIEVIYPGVPSLSRSRAARPREPLVLFVGSLFTRRHIPELIEGFARVSRRASTARLAIVGDDRCWPRIDIAARVRESPAADRIQVWSYVEDAVLADLYGRASAFAFLSEYEGFGLTPLEALAAGIPIVVLDTPVAREVCGPAAIYVARPDPVLVEAALDQALFDENTRARILAEAPAVLARYSWRDCAARVLDVLVRAAASQGLCP
jgi:glycosyltransferase involved in cell wall biosynthesis